MDRRPSSDGVMRMLICLKPEHAHRDYLVLMLGIYMCIYQGFLPTYLFPSAMKILNILDGRGFLRFLEN